MSFLKNLENEEKFICGMYILKSKDMMKLKNSNIEFLPMSECRLRNQEKCINQQKNIEETTKMYQNIMGIDNNLLKRTNTHNNFSIKNDGLNKR